MSAQIQNYEITLRADQCRHLLTILAWVKENHRQRRIGSDIDRHAHDVCQVYVTALETDILAQIGDDA